MQFKYKHGSPMQKKQTNKIYKDAVRDTAREEATRTLIMNFLAICAESVADAYGFGDKRLNRWKKKVDEKLDCINSDHVNWDDIRGNIKIVHKEVYKIDKDKIKRNKKKK